MSEGEKRGLFGRLFGGRTAAPAVAPTTSDTIPATDVPSSEMPGSEAPLSEAPGSTDASIPVPLSDVPEPVSSEPPAGAAPGSTDASVPMPIIEATPLEITPAAAISTAVEPRLSWWQKLKSGLGRTSSALGSGLASLFTKRRLDDDTLEELEDLLIQADLGLATATRITDVLRKDRFDKEITDAEVRGVMAGEIEKVLTPVARPLDVASGRKPHVVLVVGVNGSGKTTTIGKLAMKLTREGKSVMLCAGDTFRAAAIEQLKIWGSRTGAAVVAREPGADAAGLAFDALDAAQRAGTDVLVIDTAGRLQNRTELMAELEKVVRVIKKKDPTAPHDVVLTLDATTGQNAVNQVEIFGRVAGVTGLVMTKLDGTARGGILVAVAEKFGLPVHFIGVGEGVDDLEPFDAADFAKALAGLER